MSILTTRNVSLFLALVLIVVPVGPSANASEEEKPERKARAAYPTEVLVSAESKKQGGDCGQQELRYELQADRYSPDKVEWLRAVLNYVHTPGTAKFAGEAISSVPVGETEIRALITNKEFAAWAGLGFRKRLGKFVAARAAVKAGHRLDSDVSRYWDSQKKLVSLLHTQFGITVNENYTTCE